MSDKHFEYEEAFHKDEGKEIKKDRKILSKTDRSKFKKTDLDKKKRVVPTDKDLKRGRILAIMADGILVDCDNHLYTCSLKGSLKKESTRAKNIVAVGDFVLFLPVDNETGAIAYVEERTSILSRAEQISRRKEQLIAVNIDQVLITASVVSPILKPPLIDRYIIASLKGNMDPVIVVNKTDLLKEDEEENKLFDELLSVYGSLGIPIYPVSTKTGAGLDALKKAMQGKSSVFSGQSGTGKTSLINAILGTSLTIGAVVERTRKGSHTTTFTHLIPLEKGGFCIDTPGIKSFGMWQLKVEEVEQYFSEIAALKGGCKYPNCTHMHEPQCVVRDAVDKGEISRLRFDSYCALITSLKEQHNPR